MRTSFLDNGRLGDGVLGRGTTSEHLRVSRKHPGRAFAVIGSKQSEKIVLASVDTHRR